MRLKIEIAGEGLQFPEGPIAMRDGSVVLVEMRRGTLTRVRPDGRVEIVADLGGSPNGAAIGPDGCVYVCNSGGFEWHELDGKFSPGHKAADYTSGSIQRVQPETGDASILYTKCGDHLLSGPNDLVFDRAGGFWFTDFGRSTENHKEHGSIYYAKVDGSQIERMIALESLLGSPNGIGLSQDERTLFVSDTFAARLWAFDLAGPGRLSAPAPNGFPGRVIGNLPGLQLIDSLALDVAGNICVATILNGGISLFQEGSKHKHIAFPDSLVTNICFGGEDMRTAWVTGADRGLLFRCRWEDAGQRLNFNG
jgi:gluconolactonase